MTYKKPDPGKGWRLLKLGEKKVAGETFFDVDFPERGLQETCCAGEIFNRSDVGIGMFYRTREGVKPKPYTAKASITVPADYLKAEKWRRLALRMSKAKTIREAREIYKKGVGK